MTSQENRNAICPESTIESANRRNFIRKAVLATGAVGIGATLTGTHNIVPESSAKTTAGCTVTTSTLFCNLPHTLAVWAGPCDESTSITGASDGGDFLTGAVAGYNKLLCGHHYGVGLLNLANKYPCPCTCSCKPLCNQVVGLYSAVGQSSCCPFNKPVATAPTGVFGVSSTGHGVAGISDAGHGVCGTATAAGGVGVRGVACDNCAVPLVARGTSCQGANLQQWQRGCTKVDVVNKCGWFGIGTCAPAHQLDVVGRIRVCCSASSGIGISASASGTCGWGVYGYSGSSSGRGVFAYNNSTTGSTYGLFGQANSPDGVGVHGEAIASGGVGVRGFAGGACSIAIVAKGSPGQKANLQEWQNACGTVFAVVSPAGSLGLGGVTNPHHVLCISGKAHASSGFSIGPCVCVNTTLAVNGSFAAKTRTVGSTTTLLTTDYAILATGTITLTLPPAKTQNGMTIFIKNTSTGTISVVPGGTDSIEGSSSARTLTKQYDSLTLISNGSNEWFIQSGVKCGAVLS